MTWEILFVLVLLAFAVTSFWLERYPADHIAVTVLAALLLAGMLPIASTLPETQELLTVFANPAPLTIAAMFILSSALEKCGAIKTLASSLNRLTRFGYRRFLLLLILFVATISAFINNTPVVMVFLPVIMTLSRSLGVPASKLLIPLSYASIFGGTCTLVGTSTNILASGILERAGYPPIGMFELAGIGVPLLALGSVYLAFVGHRALPERETLTSILSDEERKEFLTEAFVQHGSPLVGQTAAQSGLLDERAVRVVEIIRDDVALSGDPRRTRLHGGDRLILSCRPSGFAHARSIEGLGLRDSVGLETVSAQEGAIVEGVLGPRSTIVGQRVRNINFRQRFRVNLMAIHRRGINLRDQLDSIKLEIGDLLLLMGTDPAIAKLRRGDDILLLDKPQVASRSMRRKTPIVLATVAAVILAASLKLVPIVVAAILGAAMIFLTDSLKSKDGYSNIEWSILVLIYGMLALGQAMHTTGTAELIARSLTSISELPFIGPEMRPYVVLAMLYFGTMILTETLSNNATIVLMAPIALSLGLTMGVDPRPFVIATCIAASASFSTPIGYQTNTYVYGVGGYRFTDFTRVGLPLNLLYFVASSLLIPHLWEF